MTGAVEGKTSAKTQLMLLVLVFLVPVIAAKLLLSGGFKGEISTHGGILLTDNLNYQNLTLTNPESGNWQLMYIANEGCDDSCWHRLYHLQQVWQALGRLQVRVKVVVATDKASSAAAPEMVDLNLISVLDIPRQATMPHNRQVVIVDPLGNFVMRFNLPEDQQQSLVVAHDMLLDIKQLLKLSRIG